MLAVADREVVKERRADETESEVRSVSGGGVCDGWGEVRASQLSHNKT